MQEKEKGMSLSIIVTVVSGKAAMRRCLTALYPQIDFGDAELIVPFDRWSKDVGELSPKFPEANFHFIDDLGLAEDSDVAAHEHRLYDRRRAIGLRLAAGRIVAMTEDHATPSSDWCKQIAAVHEQPYDVIGGAIENGIDKPLNWAWYYCDFGRYGRPFTSRTADYVSDVNVSYKKSALDAVREVWHDGYRETILHWRMREHGSELFLDDRLVVHQERPRLPLAKAFRERVAWGRVFAETRVAVSSIGQRLMFAAGTFALPPLLLVRSIRNMRRQDRSFKQMAAAIPIVFLLLVGWSLGELIGYVAGPPATVARELETARS